jgi:hypothetical protein
VPEPKPLADGAGHTLWLRWGIEAMFSDFKTRGFGLEDSHIRLPERLDHLVLVMALALYWAVSTGMWDAANRPTPAEKNSPRNARETTPEPSPRSSPEASDAFKPASSAPGPHHPSGAHGQTDSW